MRFLSRVVWSEGMHLGPHHFQLHSRYFEDSIQFATTALWYEPYGFSGYELDEDALQSGIVSLLHARGIFPDGLSFHMPESSALPPARSISDLFPPARDSLTVLLAVPKQRIGGKNCATSEQDESAVRYSAETRPVHDENSGLDERPVSLGRKNIRLLLDTEPQDDFVTMQLARVRRDGSGHFVFDSTLIPPCLQISACGPLMLMLRRLIDILEEKSRSLRSSPGAGKTLTEFSSREIAAFWLLHAVNSGLAPLTHLWTTKRGHPEELYLEMSRLAGSLCTFTLESHPNSLPAYDHLQLGETFQALDRQIRAHLETVLPTNCLSIRLNPAGKCLYEGDIVDQRCLGSSRWVFAIRSKAGEAEIISRGPHLVKICSAQFVPELVKRAVAGLTLTHLPTPPSAISARVDTQYFSLNKSGPCWDHIVQTRRVGAYIPSELPVSELELLIVLDS